MQPINTLKNLVGSASRLFMTPYVPCYRQGGPLHIPLPLDGTVNDTGVPSNDRTAVRQYFATNARFFANLKPECKIYSSPAKFQQAHQPVWLEKVVREIGNTIIGYRDLAAQNSLYGQIDGLDFLDRLAQTWLDASSLIGALLYMGDLGGELSAFRLSCCDLALYGPCLTPGNVSLKIKVDLIQQLIRAHLMLKHGMMPRYHIETAEGKKKEVYDPWSDLRSHTLKLKVAGRPEIYLVHDDKSRNHVFIQLDSAGKYDHSKDVKIHFSKDKVRHVFEGLMKYITSIAGYYYVMAHYQMTSEEIVNVDAIRVHMIDAKTSYESRCKVYKQFLEKIRKDLPQAEYDVAAGILAETIIK